MLGNFGGFPVSPALPYLMLHDASRGKDKRVKEVSRELRSAGNIRTVLQESASETSITT